MHRDDAYLPETGRGRQPIAQKRGGGHLFGTTLPGTEKDRPNHLGDQPEINTEKEFSR